MMMLLLVSAVALLVSPAAIEPKHIPANNLNSIIDLVEKYNESFPKVRPPPRRTTVLLHVKLF